MLISERNSKTTNYTSKNVEKLSSAIEFVGLMNERVEALINSLSDHLSPWDQLSIELMENILEVVSLNRLF